MKTEELMIGDWVMVCPLSHRLESKPSEVIMIGVDWLKTSEGSYDEELIEPIPLTEEILTANEFIPDSAMTFVKKTDNYSIKFSFITNKSLTLYKLGAELDLWDVLYVHELQHALRLCGLTELADNFKIKADEE